MVRLTVILFLLLLGALSCLTIRSPVTAIPIEEAIKIAHRSAKEWREDAQLQFITSRDTDMDLQDSGIPGLDGRRRAWSFQFKDPKSHETIIVDVLDGAVTNLFPAGVSHKPGMDLSEIHLNGSELTKTAAYAGLKPGKGWAVGYHFRFNYLPSIGHFVQVIGLNQQDRRSNVLFSPETGKLLRRSGV